VVSVSSTGGGTAGGNGNSLVPAISGDGTKVAFVSDASDLTAGPKGEFSNVYMRDLAAGTTQLVSADRAGAGTDGATPAISADGLHVAFRSTATLTAEDTPGDASNIFVRDLATATTRLISLSRNGARGANGSSSEPSISADGQRVAFVSTATDLTSRRSPRGKRQVFMRDLNTGTTRLISLNVNATAGGNDHSLFPSISGDGRFVAFTSLAGDLTPDATQGFQVFIQPVD
jgi:TolB protein